MTALEEPRAPSQPSSLGGGAEQPPPATPTYENLFPTIRVGERFTIPAANGAESETSILHVAVVYKKPRNIYFSNGYDPGNLRPPACVSNDCIRGSVRAQLKTIDGTDHHVFGECAVCHFNQWKSAADGKGKACQNRMDLFLSISERSEGGVESFSEPCRLSIPPNSVPGFDVYFQRLVETGTAYFSVIVCISLRKEDGRMVIRPFGAQMLSLEFAQITDDLHQRTKHRVLDLIAG